MTERERWVVYPLLFLALGAALRDKLFDRTTTRSIVCEELMVVDREPLANRAAGVIARIGRIDTSENGAAVKGLMIINGQLNAEVVNARQYAYHDVPFAPAVQALPVGLYYQLLQAMQQAAQRQQQPQEQPQQPAPPVNDEKTPRTPPDDEAEVEPLAAPEENR